MSRRSPGHDEKNPLYQPVHYRHQGNSRCDHATSAFDAAPCFTCTTSPGNSQWIGPGIASSKRVAPVDAESFYRTARLSYDTHNHDVQPNAALNQPNPSKFIRETTDTQEPVTPTQILPSFQHNKSRGAHHFKHSPDGNVSTLTTPVPYPLVHTKARQYHETSPTPNRFANIRVQRSQQASTLLASPPRAGHSSRLRQLFDAASLEHTPYRDGSVVYPQLPNISRAFSPTAPGEKHRQLGHHDIPSHRPGFPLPAQTRHHSAAPNSAPGNQNKANPSPATPSNSSESWSGDSSYLEMESPRRVPASASISQPHIDDWLSTLSPEASLSRERSDERGKKSSVRPSSKSNATRKDVRPANLPSTQRQRKREQEAFKEVGTDEDDGVGLMFSPIRPLGQNICTERGSPHHSHRSAARGPTTDSNIATPEQRSNTRHKQRIYVLPSSLDARSIMTTPTKLTHVSRPKIQSGPTTAILGLRGGDT